MKLACIASRCLLVGIECFAKKSPKILLLTLKSNCNQCKTLNDHSETAHSCAALKQEPVMVMVL